MFLRSVRRAGAAGLAQTACRRRGSVQPSTCNAAPLRFLYEPVPERVHDVETA